MVERLVYTEDVGGSIPSRSTRHHQGTPGARPYSSAVEHGADNSVVPGSIPGAVTNNTDALSADVAQW